MCVTNARHVSQKPYLEMKLHKRSEFGSVQIQYLLAGQGVTQTSLKAALQVSSSGD